MTIDTCYFCTTETTTDTCPQCQQVQVLHGKYRLLKVLGQGGFGVVYQARDLRFDRIYAIKVIISQTAADQQLIQSEADILARYARKLDFMPEMYDHWIEGNKTYLVMEFVDGQTLDAIIEQHGRVEPRLAFAMLKTLLEHLRDLHAVGIIHRDIKPENISHTSDGRLVLLDFGISKQHNATLTAAKALSPYYSSPEQTKGLSTDQRSDLYSLGATIYHLVTGETPPPSLLRLTKQIEVTSPQKLVPQISLSFNVILLRLLQLEPDQRPQSAEHALEIAAGSGVAKSISPVAQSQTVSHIPVNKHDRRLYSFVEIVSVVWVAAILLLFWAFNGTRSRAITLDTEATPVVRSINKEPTAIPFNPATDITDWQQRDAIQLWFAEDVNTGETLELGDLVELKYTVYNHQGTVIQHKRSTTIYLGQDRTQEYLKLLVPEVEQGLVGLNASDIVYLEVPANVVFSDTPMEELPRNVDPRYPVYYQVEIVTIKQ